jgi:hypothetical protein
MGGYENRRDLFVEYHGNGGVVARELYDLEEILSNATSC